MRAIRRIHANRRSIGWSGLAMFVLFGAGSALWALDMPEPGASAEEVVKFYEDAANRIVVGGSLSLVAAALLVHFAAGMRRHLAEVDRDDVLATTAFGGALLGAGAGVGAETINMAGGLRAREGELSPELARSLFETSQVLGFNAAGVGIGTFGIATAAVALRRRTLLPRWIAVMTVAASIALLTPLSRRAFPPALLLLPILSVQLLRDPGPAKG